MNKITFEQFLEYSKSDLSKIETKIGTITNVERIPKNKKMIKITVEFANNINKTVISNIGGNMKDVTLLINKCFPFITNIEPVEKNGHLSEAIIVADINENNFDFESGFTVTN